MSDLPWDYKGDYRRWYAASSRFSLCDSLPDPTPLAVLGRQTENNISAARVGLSEGTGHRETGENYAR